MTRPSRPSAPKLNWFDRLLIGIAPAWGLRRVQARAAAFAYEAAAAGRRTSSWHRSSADANTAAGPSLTSLRELARDLHRNNGWARRGIKTIKNNTVGWGIQPRPSGGARGARMQDAADLWTAWSRSPACDFDGRLPFTGLQGLIIETVSLSGEALVVRRRASPEDGLPIPLRLQVLEPDYLSAAQDGITTAEGNVIIQGVEFDTRGRRVAYHLYDRHPGSGLPMPGVKGGGGFVPRRVPAEDVLHVYLVERPGQVRGVPWLASAISRLNDFDDFEDAQLMQQKVAACFAAFVEDPDGTAPALGEPDDADDQLETLEPGHINYLTPGKKVSFATPPVPTDGSFTVRQLRRVAASLGVTYEDLTGDYSNVNFSSARMARLAHWQSIYDWQWNMLIPQFCDGVWGWVMEMARELENWRDVPTADWVPPPMPMLEPDKEGLAYQRLVRSGAMTLSQMIRALGYDPETHLAEIAADNKRLDELKIILDSDARHTTSTGQAQGAAAPKAALPAPAADASGDGEAPAEPASPKNGKSTPASA